MVISLPVCHPARQIAVDLDGPTPLLTRVDAAPNLPDELCQAAKSGDMRGLKAALASNVDVNARDADGHTALVLAIQHDHAAIVRELLTHGADVKTADSRGYTPLKAARIRGNLAVITALKNFATH